MKMIFYDAHTTPSTVYTECSFIKNRDFLLFNGVNSILFNPRTRKFVAVYSSIHGCTIQCNDVIQKCCVYPSRNTDNDIYEWRDIFNVFMSGANKKVFCGTREDIPLCN